MDYKLPGIDGCETLKEIRKITRDIPIVMQTAYAHALEKELRKDCPFDDFITKPIISKELFRIINKYYSDEALFKQTKFIINTISERLKNVQ